MELLTILKGISDKRNEMVKRNAKDNPAVMNDIMLELAQLYHFLGEAMADKWLEFRQFKAQKFHAYRNEGKSSSAAETEVSMDQEVLVKEADYRRLSNIDKRTSLLISACQTHLRHKAEEARQQL